MSWIETMWHTNLREFNKQYRSVLPYSYYLSEDKQTATFEMALAGYAPSDIEVTYSNDGILSVKTNAFNKGTEKVEYVHKGIAQRFMQFCVPMWSSYVIKESTLRNGILKITFEKLPASPPTRVEVKSL